MLAMWSFDERSFLRVSHRCDIIDYRYRSRKSRAALSLSIAFDVCFYTSFAFGGACNDFQAVEKRYNIVHNHFDFGRFSFHVILEIHRS